MDDVPSRKPSRRLLRDAERHFDYYNFDDLLETASSTCLREMPDYTFDDVPLSDEQRLILRLGTRGLNNALDTIDSPFHFVDSPATDETDGAGLINAWLPLRDPDIAGGQLDFTVQRKIERFGEALLDEAYRTLGTDVGMHVEAFKRAGTVEDQLVELNWLNDRINRLSERAPIRQDGSHFYHPLMLSPTAIGQFPHHRIEPTCLGKSILTSSFVRQTGADALHAGVIQTASEDDFNVVRLGALLTKRMPVIPVDSEVADRLDRASKDDFYDVENDPGFHASSLVRLLDDNWYVLDPNFGSVYKVEKYGQPTVQKAFEEIAEFAPIAKGIERQVHIGQGGLPEVLFQSIHELDLVPDANEVAALLDVAESDTIICDVRKWVEDVLEKVTFEDDSHSALFQRVVKYTKDEQLITYGNLVSLFEETLSNSIEDYLLWGMDTTVFIDTIRNDTSFRNRRIEDLRALPSIVVFGLLLLYVDTFNQSKDYEFFHDSLEVGEPAYRVGAAVLSDFATYCGDNLSYTFWNSHWSSLVSVTERLKPDMPDHESGIAYNNMVWLDFVSPYTKQDGIVKKFRTQLKESETDGG